MTKRHLAVTIGMTCSKGVFCKTKLAKPPVISVKTIVCLGNHTFEIYDPTKKYTDVFDTIRPEIFIGPKGD